jgi:hypothetical protein
MLKNVESASVATALARNDLPVPGGGTAMRVKFDQDLLNFDQNSVNLVGEYRPAERK